MSDKLKLQVINNSGVPLRYATDGSAGIDFPLGTLMNESNGIGYFNTGVKIAVPPGYCGLLLPRSSLHKQGWRLANTIGLIDSDYRGDIVLAVDLNNVLKFRAVRLPKFDDYVAQLVIVPVPAIEIEQVTSLPDTVRGAGGFGSTDSNKGEPQRKEGVEL